MSRVLLVSIFCDDRVGLVSGVTGLLFDQAANLRDVSFAVLGRAAEFAAVCEMPDHVTAEALRDDLATLPVLAGAEIKVAPFDDSAATDTSGRVTHRIEISGGDQPGLIARLSEIFASFEANVVELDARTLPPIPGPPPGGSGAGGDGARYVMRFAVWLPAERAEVCLSAVANTTEAMGLACTVRSESGPTG